MSGLTRRELQVLTLYARHGHRQAIAAETGTSPRTVDRQLDSAYRKLKVTNAIDAFRVMGWLHA